MIDWLIFAIISHGENALLSQILIISGFKCWVTMHCIHLRRWIITLKRANESAWMSMSIFLPIYVPCGPKKKNNFNQPFNTKNIFFNLTFFKDYLLRSTYSIYFVKKNLAIIWNKKLRRHFLEHPVSISDLLLISRHENEKIFKLWCFILCINELFFFVTV